MTSIQDQAGATTPSGMPDLTSSSVSGNRNRVGTILTIVSGVFVAFIIIPLLLVLWDVGGRGLPLLFNTDLYTELPPPPGLEDGGFGHAIIGSLMTLGIAAAISFPVGVLAAVYLAEFGRGTRIAYLVKFSANVLTGVPAILIGLFAYTIVVRPLGSFSAFSGGVALGVLMLPIVIRSTEEALLLVPNEMRQAATGIGATRFQTITRIIIPAAMSAIVTGLILSLARAAGEAAPLLFTAFNNSFWNTDPMRPIATLPVLIYFFSIIPYKPQQDLAWAAAVVLLIIVLTASLLARFFSRAKKF
ncbi:MAG: phosphate ABC transporter permease PstA [Leptolyngbya sp. DLM2.Bin15]|nr:MAG: phosphate ABC transporter permease PstA [Leptolyngbya sp. DLM2.Bin15]